MTPSRRMRLLTKWAPTGAFIAGFLILVFIIVWEGFCHG